MRGALFVGLLVVVSGGVWAGEVGNGEFEEVEGKALARWEVRATGATVGADRVRGKWYHFICDVKTGRFDKIHLYLSLADGVGTTWWDNFKSEKLAIVNPSFEEVTPAGGLVGWRQDNANVTIFADDKRLTHGKRSLRITHADADRPLSRVRQIIAVDKNTDYRFEFDIFLSDDCAARPNIATLTYESDGKYSGSPMWVRTASWSDIRTERAGHGEYVAVMDLAGGTGELTQTVPFAVDCNGEAAASVKTMDLEGNVRLVVEDADSGAVLGEASETDKNANWHEVRTRFQSAGAAGLRMRLIGTGRGQVRLDQVSIREGAELVPPAQHVNWQPAGENYVLPESLTIHVDGPTGRPFEGAMAILNKDLATLNVRSEIVSSPRANLQVRIGPGLGVRDRGPESYSLVVNPAKIWIAAESDLGVLRAVATLVQLFQRYPGADGPVTLTCEVSDYADMPVRGGFWSPQFQFERFARYKFNTMYYSTSYWLDWIDEPQQVARLEPLFDEAEKYGVEILASTGVFQGGYVYRFHNPALTEGKWVEGERLRLAGTKPVPLKHPLVIGTELRGLNVRSPDGKTTYRECKDYRVERGTPLTYPFKKLVGAKPDAIARMDGGGIPDGGEAIASYNYAEPSSKSELCMSEPAATRIVADALAATFAKFPRLRYFNLNLDEIAYFKSCGLCRADKRRPEDLSTRTRLTTPLPARVIARIVRAPPKP